MFDIFINLVSDDALAAATISLAEKFQCAPIDMLNAGCGFFCLSAFIFGLLTISVLDHLLDKAFLLLEKFGPLLIRFIVSTLTALYLFLRRKLVKGPRP